VSETHGEGSFHASAGVVHGRPFWAIVWAGVAFLLAVEGNLLQMLVSGRPWIAVVYFALMAGTVWLFITPRFQEWFYPHVKKRLDRIENMPR
jgi:membrane protein YdbS with pleckstrin-like domain